MKRIISWFNTASQKAEDDMRYYVLWWGVVIVTVGTVMFGVSKI